MIVLTRQKKIFGLIVIFLLVLGGYFLLTKINDQDEASDTSVVAFLTDTDEISAVSFSVDGESFSFRDDNGGWVLDSDSAFPLDASALNSALSSLSEISASRELTGVTDFSSYGLDDPAYEIKLTSSSDGETTLAIGDKNALTGAYYFHVNDSDTVYLVDSDVYDIFDRTLFDFIATDTIPSLTDVASLTFDNEEKTTFVQYPHGYDGCYSSSYTWFTKDGDALTAADSDDVESLVSTISGMTWTRCVAYNVGKDDLAAYGLDDPAGTVSVDYTETSYVDSGETDDDGNTLYDTNTEDKTFTLLIGDRFEENAGEGEEATVYYYAKTADSDLVYLIPGDTAEMLLAVDDTTCPVWDLCRFDRTLLTAVDIDDNGDTHKLSVSAKTAKDDGEDTTTYTYTLDGESVDGGDFFAELDSVEGMKTTRTPEKAEGDVILTLTFHQDREGFETMKMTFAKYSDDYYLVSFNGASSLLISASDFGYISDAIDALVADGDE